MSKGRNIDDRGRWKCFSKIIFYTIASKIHEFDLVEFLSFSHTWYFKVDFLKIYLTKDLQVICLGRILSDQTKILYALHKVSELKNTES